MQIYDVTEIQAIRAKHQHKSVKMGAFMELYATILKNPPELKTFIPNYKQNGGQNAAWRKKKLLEKGENAWKPVLPDNDIERIQKTINGTLNKLTESNYAVIAKEFLSALLETRYSEVISVLCDSIFSKIVYDKGFHKLYANLCNDVAKDIRWQQNLVSIVNKEDGVYWALNILDKDNMEFRGPFKTQKDAQQNCIPYINFRRAILKKLQSEFDKRIEYIKLSKEDEEVRFKYRRSIFGNAEFICEMHRAKIVTNDVLNYCFLRLLGMQTKTTPQPEEIEAFVSMWKYVKTIRHQFGEEYYQRFKKHVETEIFAIGWESRIRFMLEDHFREDRDFVRETKKEVVKDEVNAIDKVREYVKNEKLTVLSGVDRVDVFYNLLMIYIDRYPNDGISSLYRKYYDANRDDQIANDVLQSYSRIMEEMEDIKIDTPFAPKYLSEFIIAINSDERIVPESVEHNRELECAT